jgi:DNA primase
MTPTTTVRLDVAAVKRQHSLAAVVQAAGVALRSAGPQRLLGCCPFHADRRPSFLVDEHDGHFHCFACHAHGDVLDFLIRREGLDFRQALERLGGMPPVGRPPATSTVATRERRWDRLTLEEQVLMNTAAAIYQDTLWHTPQALAYLRQRGLPDWLIRAAGLGYADGQSLEVWLRRHSGLRLAQALGLLGARGRERLAGRVVVPELRGGHCIWLIGRTLADAPDRPKYVALPGERPLLGQERAAGRRQVFFVEGVFDFLTALAWKLPACSPCGTSLPAERLGCLARAQVIYGVFDADQEGRAAATRFGDLLGTRWRPIDLPDGSDLADLASRPQGRATFFQLLAASRRAQGEGVSDVAG